MKLSEKILGIWKRTPHGPKLMLYRIDACIFKRTQESWWVPGLLLNEGDLGIIDCYGTLLDEVWTWRRDSTFAIDILSIFDTIKQKYHLGE